MSDSSEFKGVVTPVLLENPREFSFRQRKAVTYIHAVASGDEDSLEEMEQEIKEKRERNAKQRRQKQLEQKVQLPVVVVEVKLADFESEKILEPNDAVADDEPE
jgi:DNA-directed RNA polymerase subunit F